MSSETAYRVKLAPTLGLLGTRVGTQLISENEKNSCGQVLCRIFEFSFWYMGSKVKEAVKINCYGTLDFVTFLSGLSLWEAHVKFLAA